MGRFAVLRVSSNVFFAIGHSIREIMGLYLIDYRATSFLPLLADLYIPGVSLEALPVRPINMYINKPWLWWVHLIYIFGVHFASLIQ